MMQVIVILKPMMPTLCKSVMTIGTSVACWAVKEKLDEKFNRKEKKNARIEYLKAQIEYENEVLNELMVIQQDETLINSYTSAVKSVEVRIQILEKELNELTQ